MTKRSHCKDMLPVLPAVAMIMLSPFYNEDPFSKPKNSMSEAARRTNVAHDIAKLDTLTAHKVESARGERLFRLAVLTQETVQEMSPEIGMSEHQVYETYVPKPVQQAFDNKNVLVTSDPNVWTSPDMKPSVKIARDGTLESAIIPVSEQAPQLDEALGSG